MLLPRFDPAALLAVMTRERVTHWIGVPTMYWSMLRYVREQGIDVSAIAGTLKIANSGGAPMPVELMKDFQETFGVRIIEGYGLSENVAGGVLQPSGPAIQARDGGAAAVLRRHHDASTTTMSRCRRGSRGRWSFAGTTS